MHESTNSATLRSMRLVKGLTGELVKSSSLRKISWDAQSIKAQSKAIFVAELAERPRRR